MPTTQKKKLICIASPTDRTYYRATVVAKEFIDREQNIVNTTGTLPDGEVYEFTVSSATVKHFRNGKLDGKLQVINLTDGSVSFSEEYTKGILQQIHEKATPVAPIGAAPRHEGTTLKTSKGTHSFYCNGKEVAEETVSSNGASLELLGNIPDGEVKEFNEKDQIITLAHYKNNKLNGELIHYTDNGQELSREHFIDGLLQGEATYITQTNKEQLTAKCTYRNSRLHGERTLTQQDGTLRCLESYSDGQLNGPRITYYPSGRKKSEENYTEGRRHGKRELFFPDGALWYVENYLDGKLDGQRQCFFQNGEVWFYENYTNGRLDGERKKFFPDGKLELEEFYSDGLLEGKRNLYDEEGNLISHDEYHWGALAYATDESRKK
ncbi:toxin-antitoxin system YwqK family antitoxin [Candidatus Avelusimicrobium luingense]|uniref:toxin-antitoxin system YwqK family antitoxin n=1 Tax=Candidatus Avelusimicrobium luingense TaxID=3416211 RepID=UPI003D1535E6